MACRYTYQGKTYEAQEFDDVLRAMRPVTASQYMPSVKSIPDAPFIQKTDAWVSLALKRMISYAAENGFDKIAFVNGEQSAERYSLSSQVESINIFGRSNAETGEKTRSAWLNKPDGSVIKVGVDNSGVVDRSDVGWEGKPLADVIGKEMADRVMAAKIGSILSGLDLKVGGEGMKKFYDAIVPTVAKDVLRKLGGGQMGMVAVKAPSDGSWGQYTGPEPSSSDVRAAGFEAIAKDMEKRGVSFGKAAKSALNFTAMQHFGGDLAEAVNTTDQPGFDITPAMRDKVAAGLPMFGRVAASAGAQAQANGVVQKQVDAIKAKWANAPEIIVAFDMQDAKIPQRIRDEDLKQRSGGATGTPEGFYYKGVVYLMASQLRTPKDTARVLFHESLGHYGLRGVFGEQLKPILQQLAALRKKEVRAKATEYGLRGVDNLDMLTAAEEVLAEMAQSTPDLGFVKRAIAIIRSWLRRNVPGFKNMALTDAEIINDYILPARGFVERGAKAQMRGAVPAFMRGTNDSVTNRPGDWAESLPRAGELVDGRTVRSHIPNRSSINASISNNEVLPGVRAVPLSAFDYQPGKPDQRILDLASQIKESDEINPLIVGVDAKGPYIIEGGHRLDALIHMGAKELPALVVIDRDEVPNESTAPDSGGAPMFSRTLEGSVAGALNSAKDVKLPAGYLVGDFFNANGKLSWWHKSVGTMYNLAQRNPAFKVVYDNVQNYLNDVSYYATEAADLAPNILPKLDTWKDITKTPLSPEDSKALAKPTFEGTLIWGRDRRGQPVKMEVLEAEAAKLTTEQKATELLRAGKITDRVLTMWQGMPLDQYNTMVESRYESQMLQPGIVFTPAELKSIFGLNDKQAALYQEFRTATDNSLTSLAISDMVRYGGKDVEPIKEAVMKSATVEEASAMLRDYLVSLAPGSDRADVLLDTANMMITKSDKARNLMDKGYAPLSRFGDKTVDVVDAKGERVYFGLFETDMDAGRMARRMAVEYPGATITRGTTSDTAYKMFAGVSPETLELFGSMLGLESQGDDPSAKAFQEYLKLAKSSRSAMKRLIQRKGIAGFSEDPGRVLAGFIYSNARQTSGSIHQGEIAEAVNAIPQGQGQLKDAAMALQEYIKNPQEEAQAFRGLLFAQYLGGSVASAMVNMTQPLTVTFPYLSQFGGITKAAGQMRRAAADVMKKTTGDRVLDAALKLAEEQGIVAPQEVHQLMAQAQGSGGLRSGDGTKVGDATAYASNKLTQLTFVWGKMFSSAEQFNRRLTYIAAYRTAVEQLPTLKAELQTATGDKKASIEKRIAEIRDPSRFAAETIAQTQFTYNKGSKPKWARGAIGGVLFTFKQYSINYLELVSRMATQGGPEGKKAAVLMIGVLMLMGGGGGLPFVEDVEDLIDGMMQRLGYNFSSKQKRNEFIAGVMGRDAARFLDSGVSGLPGVPIDFSGRMGMGNLIPGTGLFTKKTDFTTDVVSLVGPAGDLVKRGFQSANALVGGEPGKAVERLLPIAGQNLVKSYDMAMTGVYKDQKGRKVIDVDGYDAFAKAIGFQPNDVARDQDRTRNEQVMIAQNKLRESEIAEKWAQGVAESSPDKVIEAREMLKDWNEKNPDLPIRINMMQVSKRVRAMRMDKETRILKSAPKEIRATVREANREN